MSDQRQNNGLVLNLRKPIGWTSNDVVRFVKRRTRGKVGHAGTLDPFADGVLLVCLGAATKESPRLMGLTKEYIAEMELGIETDTLDITGRILKRAPGRFSQENMEQIVPLFIGDIEQKPPQYSALWTNGQRAYQLAREGREVELAPRTVHIHSIDLLAVADCRARLRIVCAKGTYIRSLARDMARALGTVAYLRSLTRTRVGDYTLAEAEALTRLDGLETFKTCYRVENIQGHDTGDSI
ncbi:tRNA pseudouridine(55) synthase TruB [candidate division KSB1 bacterium]|nr:tRNA pseudouridine(55) synthase TruB [candidate division KSB1 bacterium]